MCELCISKYDYLWSLNLYLASIVLVHSIPPYSHFFCSSQASDVVILLLAVQIKTRCTDSTLTSERQRESESLGFHSLNPCFSWDILTNLEDNC